MNDDLLCDRLRKGDKKALDEIYSLYNRKIFCFALSYLKKEEDSWDIVQEAFIRLWDSRSKLKRGTRLEALIFTVTKNSILSLFRKHATEKKYLEYLANSVISNSCGTEELTDLGFLQEKYEQLIPMLPPKRRAVFVLSRMDGLSNKEIALAQGISEKTVENHLTKALAFFREHLGLIGFLGTLYYFLFVD